MRGILLSPYPCGTVPCIDAAFGPTQSLVYWSATAVTGGPGLGWFVDFYQGNVFSSDKTDNGYACAVRGGL